MLRKQGTVTSAKMQGTVTVTVHQQVRHPVYKKSFRKSKNFLADRNKVEDLEVGDEVIMEECRPLSKSKHFKVIEVVKRAPRVSEIVEEAAVTEVTHHAKEAKESKETKETKEKSSPVSSDSSDSSDSSVSSVRS